MSATKALLEDFYAAFARRDGDAMAACYHPDATFSDPVFPALDAKGVSSMWRMLCKRGHDLVVTASDITADEARGHAHWEAKYTFSATQRFVHNVVEARFRFKDGRIVEHIDHFHFWRWSRMALGAPGLLLGWSPLVRAKVQRNARHALDEFTQRSPTGAASSRDAP